MKSLPSTLIALLTVSTVAAEKWISEISGETLMCSCADARECRREAKSKMSACMEECEDHLEEYGSRTTEYRACFEEHTDAIVEAEDCLFKDIENHCTWRDNEEKYIEQPKWDQLNSIKFERRWVSYSEGVWYNHVEKYDYFQNYLQCTKNCMHKKLQACTGEKGCTLRMHTTSDIRTKMSECVKRNDKIAKAILATCQCLAWKKGVTELRGACAIIGNRYYIDRA